jgi:ABC-type multidrug transport system fused ATPase/permease subunit
VRLTTAAAIRLDNVVYGNIDGMSLEVPAGARALVQVPASQRELLADLLVGLRTPARGAMLRDGQDIARLKPIVAHEEVALVRGGEPLVATVRDNIAMARPGIRDGDVWDALSRVGLASQIGRLSNGLDTVLGPGGRPLCPNDVARLLFARAVCGSPRLIVVDGVLDSVSPSTRDDLLALSGPTSIVLTVTGLPTASFDQTAQFTRSAA